jgi:MoxR-like ATPase
MSDRKEIRKEEIENFQKKLDDAKLEISKVLVGQTDLVNRLLQALFLRGHILLEGVPGIAKTTAILTLAKVCKLDFQRIQFTPDLLPSDVIGNEIYNPKDQTFQIRKGAIFTNLLLADEINRAPAKVQSALLEAMQERQVTIGQESFKLPNVFMTLATQNPIEQEGTYPLPEAQIDRFLFKVNMDYPNRDEEHTILQTVENQDFDSIKHIFSEDDILNIQKLIDDVYVDEVLIKYITKITESSRKPKEYHLDDMKNQILFGASPRGSINLMRAAKAEAVFAGRDFVTADDVKIVVHDVLRHRIIPTFEAEVENITSDNIIDHILNTIPTP